MDKTFHSISDWVANITHLALQQPWVTSLLGAAIIVIVLLALLENDN